MGTPRNWKLPALPYGMRSTRHTLALQPFFILAGIVLCLSWPGVTSAQNYPTGTVRLILPNPPSGAGDTIGRLLAAGLSKQLGQQVVVDNRPGGGGAIGVLATVNAPPDGHTLFLGNGSNMGIDPNHQKISYNPRDLVAVAPLLTIPFVMVANPSFPPNNIRQLLDLARKQPGRIDFASSGIGSAAHLATELVIAMGKVNMVHVAYKGAAPAFVDVVAGRIPFMTGDVNSALPFLNSGRLKALAVTGATRMELLPDVPTIAESGLPGYEAGNWFGVFAPLKTPAPTVATLFKATAALVQEEEFRKRIVTFGARLIPMSRTDFERYVADQTHRRTELVKSNKIVIQ